MALAARKSTKKNEKTYGNHEYDNYKRRDTNSIEELRTEKW